MNLDNEEAIWSLLLASGYLKVKSVQDTDRSVYELAITNYETTLMFEDMVHRRFSVALAPKTRSKTQTLVRTNY